MGSFWSKRDDDWDEVSEEDYPHVETGDQNAVKNILDDSIVEFFNDNEIQIDYKWDNLKLTGMVAACIIAAVCHLYKNPVISENTLVYACVGSFFVIQGLLMLYAMFIEEDILLRAVDKEKGRIIVRTEFATGLDHYDVSFDAEGSGKQKHELYVGDYFDEDGHLHKEKFKKRIGALFTGYQKAKKK